MLISSQKSRKKLVHLSHLMQRHTDINCGLENVNIFWVGTTVCI